MGLRNPQAVNRDQALAEKLADLERRLNQREALGGLQWLPLPLYAGWENLGSGWAPAAFAKDDNNMVHVRGVVRCNTTTVVNSTNASIGLLPENCRSTTHNMFLAHSSANKGNYRVDIYTSGAVFLAEECPTAPSTIEPSNWFSICGFEFPAGI
jgi:hypothetical protein